MDTRDLLGITVSKTSQLANFRDRISSLPDEVIHRIFSNLQTIEMVQASVLSKRWRYLWSSLPYLNFDKLQMPNIGGCEEKFAEFIKCVLLLRDGSDLKTLRITSPDQCDGWKYWWLDIACMRNVQEIDLDIIPGPLAWYESNELPGRIFGKSLVMLKLNFNYRKMPISLGYEGLMALHLVSVVFPNEDFVHEIFSRCPLLEKFTMERCIMRDIKVLEILASNLKHFTFANNGRGTFIDDGSFGGVLKVVAPKLLSFVYFGFVLRDYQLENLSSLQSASVHFLDFREQPSHIFCRMVKGFYNAKVLRLTIPFFQYLPAVDRQECFPTAFCNLKSLVLCSGFIRSHMQVLIHLLKHFPNLETLAIDSKQFAGAGVPNQMMPWFEAISCLRYHLKRIELINSYGTESELEFIELFLANGKVLEEVSITWTKNMLSKINQFQRALDFPKASPNVVISFPKHQPQKPFWSNFA